MDRSPLSLVASAVNYGLGMAVAVFLLAGMTGGQLPMEVTVLLVLAGAGAYALATSAVAERAACDAAPAPRPATQRTITLEPGTVRHARNGSLAPVPVRVDRPAR